MFRNPKHLRAVQSVSTFCPGHFSSRSLSLWSILPAHSTLMEIPCRPGITACQALACMHCHTRNAIVHIIQDTNWMSWNLHKSRPFNPFKFRKFCNVGLDSLFVEEAKIRHISDQDPVSCGHMGPIGRIEKEPSLAGRGCTPTPFHSIYHHEQSFGVRSCWEGRYTPPISPLPWYVLCGASITFRHFPTVYALFVHRLRTVLPLKCVILFATHPEHMAK